MLVQKNNLNKRTKVLIMIFFGILIIGGAYFGFNALAEKSEPPENLLVTSNGAINLKTLQSGVSQEIFNDTQFLSLDKNKFDGFTDQYSGIILSDSKPIAISSSQVENPKTGERLIVSWQLPEYINFDTVSIYRSSAPGYLGEQIYSISTKNLKANEIMSYQDREVEDNIIYYYVIQTEIYKDSSLVSNSRGEQINGISKDEVSPSAPDFVQVQGLQDGNIEISWFSPEDGDFDMIHVYRSTEKGELGVNIYGTKSGDIGTNKAGSSMYYILDDSAKTNLVYYYTVTSVDKSGNESTKDIISSPYKSSLYNPFDPIVF